MWEELRVGDVITHLDGRACYYMYEVLACDADTATCNAVGASWDGPFQLTRDDGGRRVTVQRAV